MPLASLILLLQVFYHHILFYSSSLVLGYHCWAGWSFARLREKLRRLVVDSVQRRLASARKTFMDFESFWSLIQKAFPKEHFVLYPTKTVKRSLVA